MAKKPETVFKDRIIPKLKALPRTYVMKTQEVSKRGVLDIIMCCNSTFVALELKKDSKSSPDALQKINIAKITQAGGISIVTHPENWHIVYRIVSEIAHKA